MNEEAKASHWSCLPMIAEVCAAGGEMSEAAAE